MTFVLDRGRADRRGARRRAGRDRQRHAAQRLPVDQPAGRPHRAGRGDGPRAGDLPAGALRVGAAPAREAGRGRAHEDQGRPRRGRPGPRGDADAARPRRSTPRPCSGPRASWPRRSGARWRPRPAPRRTATAGCAWGRTSRSRATRRSSSSATRPSSRGSATGRSRASPRAASRAARTPRRRVVARLRGQPVKPFRYSNHGDVAVIGRLRGVTDIPWMGPFGQQGGFTAWLLWLLIHITYLIGFSNRIVVVTRWAFSFLTRGRSTRLITGRAAGAADRGAGADRARPAAAPVPDTSAKHAPLERVRGRRRRPTAMRRPPTSASRRPGGSTRLPAAAVRGDDPGQPRDPGLDRASGRSPRSRRSGRPGLARCAAPRGRPARCRPRPRPRRRPPRRRRRAARRGRGGPPPPRPAGGRAGGGRARPSRASRRPR